jgi:RND superfamily putative drug exporter
LVVAAAPFALRQSDNLSSGGFSVPGSQSDAVDSALSEFPGATRAQLAVVVVAQPQASSAAVRSAVARAAARAQGVEHVDVASAVRARALALAGRAKTVILPLETDVEEDAATDVALELRERLGVAEASRGAVSTHLVGQGAVWAAMQEVSKEDLAKAEAMGFPAVLLILLGVFGSLAAAALPLALGFVSVLVTGALIFALSRVLEMSVFVTNMASMIGIGVAVDYSLFVLARYREEVTAGQEPPAARRTAMATSGVAVLFSGATVIVSLAALWMVDNTALRSMALGAILVVAVSMLASATLLPALIALLGRRAYSRSRFEPVSVLRRLTGRSSAPTSGDRRPGDSGGFWMAWTDRIMRRPIAAAAGSAGILVALALLSTNLQTGTGALHELPADHETRIGVEAAAAQTGPGAASPIRVLISTRTGGNTDAAAVERVSRALLDDPGIVRAQTPVLSRDGRAAMIDSQGRHPPESDAARATVVRLRNSLPEAVGSDAARVAIGGVTASQHDLDEMIGGSMWKIIAFLLALSYIVLVVLLRSVVLPAKAVLMNILSVGAAYGVLTLVFGEVDVLTPPLVLAVVFGLSMDYEVFLLSRIRERYLMTRDTRRAVAEGLATSAATITSAALIMVTVFATFIAVGMPSIQQIGLGTAVAIAIDATLVRLVLVPAAMELMGRWNWYMPRQLARVLPHTELEPFSPRPAR